MNAHSLRKKIERHADYGNMTIASESMSDSTEPMAPEAFFDVSDEEVNILIERGDPIRGHIEWRAGERTPFEAKYLDGEFSLHFGRWELPS